MPHVLATTEAEVDAAIWAKVRSAFAEALGLEEDEVQFDSRIIGDLDAESLDFLDVAFRLERAFDVKIPRGGIEQAARDGVGQEAYEVDGVLTEKALAGLADALPEIPRAEFAPGLKTVQVPELFRVATFYNLILRLLNDKAGAVQAAS
jgi:acyl carrier protein